MGLGIYHVGFVRSANYFFQRLQGFTPAGVAASHPPALAPRSWGLLVPSTMCDGVLLPPFVLSLLLLVWGLDPGTGSVPSSRGHLHRDFPKHPSARVHGRTADSILGGGRRPLPGEPGSGFPLLGTPMASRPRLRSGGFVGWGGPARGGKGVGRWGVTAAR